MQTHVQPLYDGTCVSVMHGTAVRAPTSGTACGFTFYVLNLIYTRGFELQLRITTHLLTPLSRKLYPKFTRPKRRSTITVPRKPNTAPTSTILLRARSSIISTAAAMSTSFAAPAGLATKARAQITVCEPVVEPHQPRTDSSWQPSYARVSSHCVAPPAAGGRGPPFRHLQDSRAHGRRGRQPV